METKQLYTQFSRAQWWNAFSYGAYKILFYSVTLTLFKTLSTDHFAQWATINSTIFLLLLWLDFGMRKSIPRFAPAFAENKTTNHLFIPVLLCTKIAILIGATPLFYWYAQNYFNANIGLIISACMLFIIEGMVALLRLIYHAYFWNKQINLLITTMTCIGMGATLWAAMIYNHHEHIVAILLIIRAAASFIIIIGGVGMLTHLMQHTRTYEHTQKSNEPIVQSFLIHSGTMWGTTILKSLTERNFLLPLFMHTFGPAVGGMFKVANDGALIFYRMVIKTIGTTDTSLLAHIHYKYKNEMHHAFEKLASRVAALCLPLLGILGICFFNRSCSIQTNTIFNLFFLMTASYLIETLLIPYERLLEVKRAYAYIGFAYVPYIICVIALASGYLTSFIGLYACVASIHAVRLVSLSLMAACAHAHYKVAFPLRFVSLIAAGCVALIVVARLAAHAFKISIPLPFFS